MDDHRWWDSADYRWKEACILWGSRSNAARVWSASPCRLQRQLNWYMGYPKLNQLLESSTYKSSTIVWDYDVHKRYEKILDILAASIGEISTERIQDDKIFIWGVEKWLWQQYYHESHQTCSIAIILSFIVVCCVHNTDAWLPNNILVNDCWVRCNALRKWSNGETGFEK